jgi:hypothetical protein
MSLEYDVEFSLKVNDNVSQTLVAQNIINGENVEFQTAVETKINEIKVIFSLQAGINRICTFVEYNNTRYKINIDRH